MPKVTFTFNLPEEESEMSIYREANKSAYIIRGFTDLLRGKTKYATEDKTVVSWDEVKTEWWNLLNEESYDPYEG